MRHLLLPVALMLSACSGCTAVPHKPAPVAPPPDASPPESSAVGDVAAPPTHEAIAPAAPAGPSKAEQLAALVKTTRADLVKAKLRPADAEASEVSVVADVFGIVGPDGGSKSVTGTTSFIERVVAGFRNDRFAKLPEHPIVVIMFPSAEPYERFCKSVWAKPCISTYGFYVPDEHRMVMNLGPGIGTLSHELTHPVVEADFPDVPTWLNEGLASLYEAPLMPKKGELHGAKNWRYKYLEASLVTEERRKDVSLPALFAMSDDTFRGEHESRNYAHARYVCQWLDEQGKLWAFYKAYRDGRKDDPRGVKAFERVMGKSVEDANGEWLKWARSR